MDKDRYLSYKDNNRPVKWVSINLDKNLKD
jgi:hypothetical protein